MSSPDSSPVSSTGSLSGSVSGSAPGLSPREPSSQIDSTSLLQRDAEGWITARPVRGREVVGRLIGLPVLLWRHRDLITTSVKRDLGARFTGTILGWIWPLLHPLFLFLAYYFIFTKLLAASSLVKMK